MIQAKRKKHLEVRKKPRQERSRETVGVILDAAARVFSESGYAAATTNHIARRAGVSIGSLYEYFPGKDAILVALTDRHIDEGEAALTGEVLALRGTDLPLADIVTRLVRAMIDLHGRDPGLHRVLFEQAPLPPRLIDRVLKLEQAMAGEVARFLVGRGFAPDDARTAARMGIEVLETLTHRLVLHELAAAGADRQATIDAQVREISFLLLGYLEGKRSQQDPAPQH